MVLVSPRICPETTDTAPNSPIARALHNSTPYSTPHLIFGRVTRKKVCSPEAPSEIAASSSCVPCSCLSGLSARDERKRHEGGRQRDARHREKHVNVVALQPKPPI